MKVKQGRYPDHLHAQDCKQDPGILLAYQPILDVEQRILGYELLYRDGEEGYKDTTDPVAATSKVIAMAFGELGMLSAMGDSTCFINIEEQILFDDVLLTLPPDRVVLELPATTIPTDAVVERCHQLRDQGYQFLLDNFKPGESAERLLPDVKFVKAAYRDIEKLPVDVGILLPLHVDLIVSRVETENAFLVACELGAKYFQGFYFANPNIAWGTTISPQRIAILSLLAMLISDADLADIEKRLKSEPTICYSLLRLANCAAVRTGRRTQTLREAMILIGRKTLQRWFQILLFSHEENPSRYPSALMLSAVFRGRFLEYLAMLAPKRNVSPEKAFMVGILSFVEALMRVPIYEVLLGLPLSEDVETALMYREGELGKLLAIAEALEQGELGKAHKDVTGLGLSLDNLRIGLVESMRFSSQLAAA